MGRNGGRWLDSCGFGVAMRRRRHGGFTDGSVQLALIDQPAAARRRRYRHIHTAAELLAFERSKAIADEIRGGLGPDERWCPGGCGKCIRRERRSWGRRWCDAVRPSWASSFRSVIHGMLDAYCELYGSEAKLLQGVLTCSAEPWWWDRSKCTHGPDVPCSGPRGCRVLESGCRGAASAVVVASARDAEPGSDVRDQGRRRERWAEGNVAKPAGLGVGGSVARRPASALRARSYDGAGEGVRACVLPGMKVRGVPARARAYVDVRAGRAGAGKGRGGTSAPLRLKTVAVSRKRGKAPRSSCSGTRASGFSTSLRGCRGSRA